MNLILSCNESSLIEKERELISKRTSGKIRAIKSKILPALSRIILLSIMLLTFGAGCILAQQPLAPKNSTNLQTSSGVNSTKSSKSKKIFSSRIDRFNNSKNETDTTQPYSRFAPTPVPLVVAPNDGGGGGPGSTGGGSTCSAVAGSISGNTTIYTCGSTTNSTTLTLTGNTGTIQWQSSTDNISFADISGATGITYTAANLASTTYYQANVSNGTCSVTTISVAITVNNVPPAIGGNIYVVGPGGPVVACSSTDSKTLTLVSYNGTIQWQSSTDNIHFADISGATGNTYTATNITTSTYYLAVVTSAACGSVSVSPPPIEIAFGTPPIITTDLTSPAAICVGGTAPLLSVTATGTTLSYQWYFSSDITSINGTSMPISGATSSFYTPSVSTAGTYYYQIQIVNNCNHVTTSWAKVVVNPLPVAGNILVGTLCAATPLNLVSYTGTIQWQSSTDNSTFTDIPGATSSAYISSSITTNTYYRAKVTSGACESVFSSSEMITVAVPIGITVDLTSPPAAVCVGGTAPLLSVTASGTALTYQWYNDVGVIIGANSNSYTPPVSTAGTYNYFLFVSSDCGVVTSSSAKVVVKAASTAPTSLSTSNDNFCVSGSATLTVIGGALGDGASWKWYSGSCGGSSIGSGTSINVTLFSTTTYFVRAEGDCNTTNCVSITVTVKDITAVSTSPLNTTVIYGSNANFSVSASGSNITYQWQEYAGSSWANINDGAKYSNTNTASLNVLFPTVSMSGYQYRCIVSGDCGFPVTSGAATLTVTAASTTSILKLSAMSVRYKDYLTLTDTVKPLNIVSALTGVVNFIINGTSYGLVNAVPIPGDAEGKLVAMLIVQINEMPGGPYTASATFTSNNANYLGSNASQTLLVTPRDASPYSSIANFYTGQVFAWSTSVTSNTATALLSAEVKDNSSPTGDVRAAKVTFYYVSSTGALSPIPGATNLAVGLINVSDGSLGTASATVKLDISNLNSASYQIAVGISGAYTNNPYDANSQVIVTVSKPLGTGYIVGGSQIANNNKSAGLIQGAATANTDYGFNVQYSKSGTNPKGQAWFIVRSYNKTDGTLDNKLHTYLLSSNAVSTFNTVIKNGTGTATFTSKANLSEELPNGTVISIEGNDNLQLVASQNGCTQQIAVTLFRKAGGIWFANNWSGTVAVLQQVNSGSAVFVAGANNYCAGSSSIILGSAIKIISLNDTNLPPYEHKVWPSPSETFFNLLIDGNNKAVAEIRIFDISGRQLNFMRAAPGALVKFGNNYRQGMYIIKVLQGNVEQVLKVVKE